MPSSSFLLLVAVPSPPILSYSIPLHLLHHIFPLRIEQNENKKGMTTDAAIQQVVQALQVLYTNPDPLEKEKANAWLEEFRKSVSTSSLGLERRVGELEV